MRDVYSVAEKANIGDRRSGIDRQRVFRPEYRPERRSGKDRRSGQDRRRGNARIILDRNLDSIMEPALSPWRGILYGILLSLPTWLLITFMIIKKITPW